MLKTGRFWWIFHQRAIYNECLFYQSEILIRHPVSAPLSVDISQIPVFFSYNVLLLNLFLTHDLVNPLHQILDDTFRANLDLQTGGDGVCLDTRDSLSSNLLDLFLLFRSPLAWG